MLETCSQVQATNISYANHLFRFSKNVSVVTILKLGISLKQSVN